MGQFYVGGPGQFYIGANSHLIRGKDSCELRFAAHEMKGRKPVEIPIPESLLPYLGHYIETVRPVLLGATDTTRLWITRYGQPMTGKALHGSICKLTERAFGQPINPHLFRDCAVTTVALEDPRHIGIAPSILAHTDPRTTHTHYIQAQQVDASRRLRQSLEVLRKQYRPAHAQDRQRREP